MILIMPTPSEDPFDVRRVTLEGQEYLFDYAYNQRENAYYLSILSTREEPLKVGLKVLTNWPLLRKYSYDKRLPPGELIAIGFTEDTATAGLGELGEGRRIELNYFTSDELVGL